MGSERLEHLVLISSEKSALDSVNVSAVVSRFAALGNKIFHQLDVVGPNHDELKVNTNNNPRN